MYENLQIHFTLLNQARLICFLYQILRKSKESLIFGTKFDLKRQRW